MKMKLDTFPDLPRDLLDCNATDNGYPPNEWDISLSRRTDFLYLIKPHPPYPLHITPNPYPILTPLNPNPRVTLGGNLNLAIVDDGPVTALKIYNLQYHLLRAANSQPWNAAVTTRQGARAFENMHAILVAMQTSRHLVGDSGWRLGLNSTTTWMPSTTSYSTTFSTLQILKSTHPVSPSQSQNIFKMQIDCSARPGKFLPETE
jgi:hypothetical protein